MNPPRWTGPNVDRTRAELLRRVEAGDPSPAPVPRAGALRLAVALVVALALIVPASVLAFQGGGRPTPAASRGPLEVATDSSYVYDPMALYAGVVGVLHAIRRPDSACFWIETTGRSDVFGDGPFFLVFPSGYRASADLELLDPAGRAVAAPGDVVAVSAAPQEHSVQWASCGKGSALGALHVEATASAAAAPTAVPTAPATSSARAGGPGCAPTRATTPTGAERARIADVDGDGRADTEWAELKEGALEFGITTASGATITGEQGFAGGGGRSFTVGRLGNGVVVAITSEGRDSPVFTFSGCAFHQLRGAGVITGSGPSSPFEFYSDTSSGAGGCFDGRLALLFTVGTSGGTKAVARFVDVSPDGRRATLTDETAVVAEGVDPTADRYSGISCGTSPVLRPIVRR